jgi:Mg/Co/Ni transporter MgtE
MPQSLVKQVQAAVRERPVSLAVGSVSLSVSGVLAAMAFMDRTWPLVLIFGIAALVALILLLLTLRDPALPPPSLLSGFEDGADSD